MTIKVEVFNHNMHWIKLSSGDGVKGDYPGCKLNIASAAIGQSITINLPQWLLPPHRELKLETERQYGISYHDAYVGISYGVQDNLDSKRKHIGWFVPWLDTRFSEYVVLDEKNDILANLHGLDYDQFKEAVAAVPKRRFKFIDYDGTEIIATTYRERRTWHRGTGWFEWVSWFNKPIARYALDISYDREVGKGKLSWKGGTLAHGIDIEPTESSRCAFVKHCQKENLKFVGEIF